MLYTERMSHVMIVAPKHYQEKVIDRLYELGACHIEDHQKSDQLDIGKPLEKGEKLAEILVKIRAIISYLGIETAVSNGKAKELTEKDYYELGKKSKELYLDVVKQLDAIKQSDQQIQELAEKAKLLDIVTRLHLKVETLKETRALAHAVGTVDSIERLRGRLDTVTKRYELSSAKDDKRNLVAIFFEQGKKDAVMQALHEAGFAEINLAGLELFPQGAEKLQRKIAGLRQERHAAEQRLQRIRQEHESFLLRNERMLAEESKKAEAPLRFAATGRSFMVKGWIPKRQLGHAIGELNRITGGKIHIEAEEPKPKESVPIKLKHPALMQPFEFLTRLYELPNYKEIDPTVLMFFTFPLFFGIMLGDVGYGLVTLLLFLGLKRKIPEGKALLNILIFASIVSIGFGFAFGEYFGFEHVAPETGEKLCSNAGICLHEEEIEHHGETITVATFPRLLSRAESRMDVFGYDVLSILVIGAVIGFIHLNLGLLLGFWNALHHHGFMHAFLEKISWMILEAGVILIAVSAQGVFPISIWAGTIVLLAGVIGIYFGDGIPGLVEMPAIFSNMLSYMRLGAVGLASVGLATVVNENLAMPMMERGGIFIILGALIFLFGHAINIGLGVLGPFLHAVRLHYVEFFTKFYQGGGIEYTPFGREHNDA